MNNNFNTNDHFFCTNLTRRAWLLKHGFKEIAQVPSTKDPSKKAYVFDKTEKLLESIAEYDVTLMMTLQHKEER